jgi:hypothetical protein
VSDDYTCPGCVKHPDIYEECYHTPSEWALAEAMRDAVTALHPDSTPGWDDPIEAAWYFLQDAEGLSGSVGEPPYSVVMTHPNGGNYVAVGIVNARYLFGSDGSDGETWAEFLGDLGGFLVPAGGSDV